MLNLATAVKRHEKAGPFSQLQDEPDYITIKRANSRCTQTTEDYTRCPLADRKKCEQGANGYVDCDLKDKRDNDDNVTGVDGFLTKFNSTSMMQDSSSNWINTSTSSMTASATDEASAAYPTQSIEASATDQASMAYPTRMVTASTTDETSAAYPTQTVQGSNTESNDTQAISTTNSTSNNPNSTTVNVGGYNITCVRTTDDRVECGDMMATHKKRGDLKERGPCVWVLNRDLAKYVCVRPSLTTPGNGPRAVGVRDAMPGTFMFL